MGEHTAYIEIYQIGWSMYESAIGYFLLMIGMHRIGSKL